MTFALFFMIIACILVTAEHVLSGGAVMAAALVLLVEEMSEGADNLAGLAAFVLGYEVEVYRADWSQGRSAGPKRNATMLAAGKPDKVLAFRLKGHSPGTDDMVRRARRLACQ